MRTAYYRALRRLLERPEARDRSLEALYDDEFRPQFFHNHMVKVFSLTAEEVAESAALDRWAVTKVMMDRTTTQRTCARIRKKASFVTNRNAKPPAQSISF